MIRRPVYKRAIICAMFLAAGVLGFGLPVAAAPPVQNPQSGSVGVEGRIPTTPPKTGATITAPANGQSFTKLPITVTGLCPSKLLVKLFANNVFVGSTPCEKGSYSLQADLFSGRNDLVARVFDDFDQPGPDSNVVTVTFNDAQFNPFGFTLLTLSSNYATRGANPGQTLVWPISLGGGTGPYAISVDWGDGHAPDLLSQQFAGAFDIKHIYDSAGAYKVVVKATDKNGFSAYLQLVATANGAVTASATPAGSGSSAAVAPLSPITWIPAAATLPVTLVAFWLGRRYELAALRKHLESEE
jgi:hypothetical protein